MVLIKYKNNVYNFPYCKVKYLTQGGHIEITLNFLRKETYKSLSNIVIDGKKCNDFHEESLYIQK